ncbi:carbohydrate-selective porin (OprB family) [Novosphingobium sp. PhB165]|uniref:carbohydrate porin n=1 Tax=Novosphingobium sp. PhB165 TaxID=2485105 RepID=UPI00104740ED|nr:carbohydrate porin [Novosphingobium sp. PhB165]TCM12844.1 carbohydrate-selective porin (OprB family) [Novosphingobium sp. PhB165]
MRTALLIAAAGLSGASPALAQESNPPAPAQEQAAPPDQSIAPFPNLLDTTLSVEGDIRDDESPVSTITNATPSVSPWVAFKQRFEARTGISFGGSYGILAQNYTDSLVGEDTTAGHKFTFNASAALLNRGEPNALHFDIAVEDRRPIFGSDLAPLMGGLLAGSGVPTAATWGDFSLGITQAYIRQTVLDGRLQYTVGKIFAPNFVNAYPFFDDNRQFLNLMFSTSPTIAVPLRGAGFVVAGYPGSGKLGDFYVKAGMFTANSSDTGWTVDDFFNRNEHFYFLELGSSSFARRPAPIHARGPMDRNNIHVTVWYRDALEPRGPGDITRPQKKAYGVAFNVNQMMGQNVMWFFRGGLGTGGFAEVNFTGGFGYRPSSRTGDLLGFGVGWSKPDDAQIPVQLPFNLRDQVTSEVFYRLALTSYLALTPDYQFLYHPSLNPTVDTISVFSIRARLSF